MNALKLSDTLDLQHTMIQYMHSGCSLRKFCDNNAERNRMFGTKTTVAEGPIRMAIQRKQVQTAWYRILKMSISNDETKYNDGNKLMDTMTFTCNPIVSFCSSLEKSSKMD